MTRRGGALPSRMRSYGIAAERRDTPDLDRLAQLFIGMAMQRTKRDRAPEKATAPAGRAEPDEVESSTQEASS